jgi:RHS repeat-associated protein
MAACFAGGQLKSPKLKLSLRGWSAVMGRWSSGQFGYRPVRHWWRTRTAFGVAALLAACCTLLGSVAPVAFAASAVSAGLPGVATLGYAKGPVQQVGSAADRAHRVPAAATRAAGTGGVHGHPAPKPDGLPPVLGPRTLVSVGAVTMPRGHLVAGHHASAAPSTSATGTVRTDSYLQVASGGSDNAGYSVASTFGTTPMADQAGYIAVTLTNTGTSTWGSGYALGTEVFASSDTTGTGTPLSTGPNVAISGTVAPNGTTTVESVTPAENPGSYEICWDMVNAAGTYFSAEGGAQYCAPYTIAQYPAQVTEEEPLPGADVDTQTPELSATATVPGGYPANPEFTFAFEILNGANPSTATVLQSSGWVSGNSSTWTPPTDLTWGTTYYWRVAVTDAATPPSLTSATWTTPTSFTVGNAQPGVSTQFGTAYQADDGDPVMTSDLGGTDYSGSGKTVDPRTGNISQQATDASVATAGPALEITRTYNSQDPRTSQALGAGWSSILDMSLAPDSDGSGALILTQADGQQVRFAKNAAGGYAPPQDLYAVITAVTGGGFTVTDQTGTTWTFTQASGSSWLLSKTTDSNGLSETFTYSSGVLTTITNNVSSRALYLTWSTPSGAAYPHVATISTAPAAAGAPGTALTWTYGYEGDLLASVCPPGTTTACTTYSYITNGSHAATSVLNANPNAYYRLDDTSTATVAADEVPVDELTTLVPPAAEIGTTPGVAGPVSAVTATGFNGSSSFIPLDGLWCDGNNEDFCEQIADTGRVLNGNGETTGSTTLSSMAVSLWFKTSSASGVLAGISGTLPGETACLTVTNSKCTTEAAAVPLLWINSSGDLQGLATTTTTSVLTSEATALSSSSAVDNGAWHQAVLIPGRALYLDGRLVASASDTPVVPAPSNPNSGYVATLGTGLGTYCTNCSPPLWQYFNGSMADASIYQNQLPGPDAVAAQYQAETTPAAELATITSPAGRTELSATYDTTDDRVSSLTDAGGGTWTYSDPALTATSAAYQDAVMSDGPEDFWPLADTSGTQASNLVSSAPTAAGPRPAATYSGVTLGKAGPMPDASATGFSGSKSQVSVLSQDFATAAPVSAEAWFNTTATGQEMLLTADNGAVTGDPLVLQLNGGCLQASLQDDPFAVAKQSTCGTSSDFIDDGAWHQAVATLSPPSAPSSGKVTQTITLYQDGVSVGSVSVSTSPTAASGDTTYIGKGFSGSIADVSVYPADLSADQVSGHYAALASQQGTIDPDGEPLPLFNTQAITVTNPLGGTGKYVYASGSLVEEVSPTGGITRYGYDDAMRADTITDADGNTTYTAHDAYNNVTSTTTCQAVNNCQTVYTGYYENLSNPLDPRNNKPTDERDARSSSPYDPTYDTVTAYTATGEIASTTSPPTAACPSGCKTGYTYTAGTEAAVGGGTEPAGLLASVTSPAGGVTSYEYGSDGDVAQVTDPLGLVTTYTYDNLGRQLTETQTSSTYPNGLTTSYAYDSQDRVLTETDPPVTDRVTGDVHTKVTSYAYDADGNVTSLTVSDGTGGDPSRTTSYTYTAHGAMASETDPLGNTTTYTYDAMGDQLTETNPAGVTTAHSYDAAGNLLTTAMEGYTGNPSAPITAENLVEESRAYDPAGQLAAVTNVMGTTTDYTYYGNGKLASSYVTCSTGANCVNGKEDVHAYGYDATGNQVSETAPDGLVADTTYNADNQPVAQTVDPTGVDRVATTTYDPDGDVVSQSLTAGGETQTQTATYNAMDQVLSQTVDNTGNQDLTTTYVRDQRGLVVSETDPEGNITTIENDEAGRPVVETAPAVASQTGNGAAPVTANPVTTTGYDTFGDQAETQDADGNIATFAYDADGNRVSATDPSYTPPGASAPVNGTTSYTYNDMGQEMSETDPDGNVTSYTYDQLGDKATETDPNNGTWTYTYDPAGDQLSVTDPTGAQTQATYDNLGQLVTATDLVRQNTSAAYTTTYGYDDAGNMTSQTSPTGVTSAATYNAVGEETSSKDGAGNTTTYAYDLDGNPVKTTLPDGTATTASYDLAGLPVSESELSATGVVLRTESEGYDADGQVTSQTDADGNTSTATYDATGMLTSQTVPVSPSQSITAGYQYDLDGNQTAYTGGNGNTTYTTYNSLGLPETTTEPATAQNPTAADSTTTDVYDGDGNLVTQDLPGGVQVSNSYDPMGDLVSQAGSGASAPTATRTYTYDGAGRMLTAGTSATGTQGTFGYQPATSESFSYDDRGLLLAAAGSAGSSSFTYNGAGQVTADTSAAGTSTYAYNSAGLLATDTDAASGVTGTYSYNDLDQVTGISYGSGNDNQSFSYDGLHRLTSDAVTTASGATVASIGYGYNNDDDVTSMTTTGLDSQGGTGTVTNTYGYDEANRLTSWTEAPAGGTSTTATYGYDADGNMINDDGVTLTYDARDELTSDSNGNTYAYSADGDLTTQATSSASLNYTSDAYGQQITDGSSAFNWDALDRLLGATEASNSSYSDTLSYDGMTDEVASDSTDTYSRDPSGLITGVDASGTQVIALDDGHNDLSGTFGAAGTSMTSSTTWDPWGTALASTGPAIQVGYQGQWTDPVTQQVNMGSRMYSTGNGNTGPRFVNQDTDSSKSDAAVTGGYSYGDDNPVTLTDLSGHSPSSSSGSGGGISAGQVAAAYERAGAAKLRAVKDSGEALALRGTADLLSGLADGEKALADLLNAAAKVAAAAAAKAAQEAAAKFAAAQKALAEAAYWQDQANAAWEASWADAKKAVTWEAWKIPGYLAAAAAEAAKALVDEGRAAYYGLQYTADEAEGYVLDGIAAGARALASELSAKARGDSSAAARLSADAAAARGQAQALSAEAAADNALASQYTAQANELAKKYAAQQARKLYNAAKKVVKKIVKKVVSVAKRVVKDVGKAAVDTSRFIAKHSQVIVQTGLAVAAVGLTVANVAQLGLDPVTDAAEAADVGALATDIGADAAEEGASTAEEASSEAADEDPEESCETPEAGGESFTAGTKVLLASGAAIPISQLKAGDIVLATNTKTGKTQPEAVTAVLVHHDTDLYDLAISDGGRTSVIDTTSNHLFFAPSTGGGGRWVKAGALKYGTHLRTPGRGDNAVVVGGWVPPQRDGWMWDLTVPGNNDHDFYVQAGDGAVLVHNCGEVPDPEPQYKSSGVRNRDSAVYINVMGEDGEVTTVGSDGPADLHAEDVAQARVPGGQMSQPYGWRTPPGGDAPEWTRIGVCTRCQATYPQDLFNPGTTSDPGGAWSAAEEAGEDVLGG